MAEWSRLAFRFAPGAIDDIAGVDCLLDLDETIAEVVGNPTDDPDRDHVMGTSESWDEGQVIGDLKTKDPEAAFALLRPWLLKNGVLDRFVVACRPDGGPTTVIHPPDFQGPFETPFFDS